MTPPCAVVLAGGESRRMRGQHKATLDANGVPLAQYVATRLSRACDHVAISYNGSADAILNGPFRVLRIFYLDPWDRWQAFMQR
jgi:molybdopterin-guanine dinucleotide biosynthesis protein A